MSTAASACGSGSASRHASSSAAPPVPGGARSDHGRVRLECRAAALQRDAVVGLQRRSLAPAGQPLGILEPAAAAAALVDVAVRRPQRTAQRQRERLDPGCFIYESSSPVDSSTQKTNSSLPVSASARVERRAVGVGARRCARLRRRAAAVSQGSSSQGAERAEQPGERRRRRRRPRASPRRARACDRARAGRRACACRRGGRSRGRGRC